MEQPQVFVNNMAIRRALAELKVVGIRAGLPLVGRHSKATTSTPWNGNSKIAPGGTGDSSVAAASELLEFHWQRAPEGVGNGFLPSWRLQLDLLTGKGFCSDT